MKTFFFISTVFRKFNKFNITTYTFCDLPELRGLFRVPASCEEVLWLPVLLEELPDELQSDAAVAAGDQDVGGRHGGGGVEDEVEVMLMQLGLRGRGGTTLSSSVAKRSINYRGNVWKDMGEGGRGFVERCIGGVGGLRRFCAYCLLAWKKKTSTVKCTK